MSHNAHATVVILGASLVTVAGCASSILGDGSGSSSQGAGASSEQGTGASSGSGPSTGSGTDASCDSSTPLRISDEGHSELATDGVYVYYTNGFANDVSRVPVCGGPVQKLATHREYPLGLALLDGNLYWIEENTGLFAEPEGGGSISAIQSPLGQAWPVTTDGAALYFQGYIPMVTVGGVMRWAPGDSAPTQVGPGGGYACLAVDDAYVYTGVGRMPKGGGAYESLIPASVTPFDGWCVAVTPTYMYATTYPGPLLRVPKGGGAVEMLSPTQSQREIVADGEDVYYGADYDGLYVLHAGATMVERLASITGEAGGITLDAHAVYWADDDGIWRLPR